MGTVCFVFLVIALLTGGSESAFAQQTPASKVDIGDFHLALLRKSTVKGTVNIAEFAPLVPQAGSREGSIVIFKFPLSLEHAISLAEKENKDVENKTVLAKKQATDHFLSARTGENSRNSSFEVFFEKYWTDGDQTRAVHFTIKFNGPDRKSEGEKFTGGDFPLLFKEFSGKQWADPFQPAVLPDPVFVHKYASAFTKQALEQVQKGDLRGLQTMEKAAVLEPEEGMHYFNLGGMIAQLARVLERQNSEQAKAAYQKAESYWRQALERFEKRPGQEKMLAQTFFQLGDTYEYIYNDPAAAKNYYEQALKLDAGNAFAAAALKKVQAKK